MSADSESTSRDLSIHRGRSLALLAGNTLVTRGLQDIAQLGNRARAEELVRQAKDSFDALYGFDCDEAIAKCTEAIRLCPEYAEAYCQRGSIYSARAPLSGITDHDFSLPRDDERELADYDKAIADLLEAVRLAPGYADRLVRAYGERGSFCMETGDFDKAIADFTEAIRLKPDVIRFCDRGDAYRERGDFDMAIADYTEAIRLEPKQVRFVRRDFVYGALRNPKADLTKADLTEALRKPIADLMDVLPLDPDACDCWDHRGHAYWHRGDAYTEKGDFDGAIADYTEVLRLLPRALRKNEVFGLVYLARGSAYYKKGVYDKAIADYTHCIQLDPTSPKPLKRRGMAYQMKSNLDCAIADFTKVIDLTPESADPYYLRGSLYGEKGDMANAVADLTEAIRLRPDCEEAAAAAKAITLSRQLAEMECLVELCNLGDECCDKGDYDQAIADYTKAIRLKPDYVHAYYGRGYVLGLKGDHDRAIADYSEAIRLKPDYADAYYNRGCAYEEKGDFTKAQRDFDEAKSRGCKPTQSTVDDSQGAEQESVS